MKLLFVHQHLGEFGGAEANILLAAGELRRRGHTPALLYRQPTGRNEAHWRAAFAECFALPDKGGAQRVQAVLGTFQPELIYLHNLSDLEVIETLLGWGAPVVRMVHDHALYCLRTYKYNYFTRRICHRPASPYCVFPCLAFVARNRGGGLPVKFLSYTQKQRELRLTRQCQALVVYSDFLKQELVRNGFDPAKIQLCIPMRIGPAAPVSSLSNLNVILFTGQLIRGKGVDALLRALAKVKVPFRARIVGDGNHRPRLEQLCARLGLRERVEFHGYVLPDQLEKYYLDASVFAMSSLWPEPFGMAGPEAMRYGLPVVAFDAGGIREWLHDSQNGFLVPWGDLDQFAAHLEELLRNKPLARQLGRRARASVQPYAAASQIDILEALFQRLLHQAAPPASRPQPAAAQSSKQVEPQKILSAYD